MTGGLPFDPFDGRPFRLRAGLRPLDLSRWIVVDDRFGAEVALKEELVASRPDVVLGVDPTAREVAGALEELCAEVGENLRRFHPDAHERWMQLAALDGLARLACSTQEDWCVLVDGRLAAGAVCFPNRWRLADKLGLGVASVHEPVARYDEDLAAPTDTALERLRPDRPMWRVNWSISDDPALHQPSGFHDALAGHRHHGDVGRDVVVRIERQTLVRLPQSGAVVFSIRTFVRALGIAFPAPADRGRLAATLSTVPDDVRAYKSLGTLAPAVLRWCAED